MDTGLVGVLLPHGIVRFHVNAFQAVPCDNVELVDGVVVLRRVARRHHDPAVRYAVAAEHLVLQELQHDGGQRLRHAVDLVQKQDALPLAGGLHHVVHGGDDLAHGVLGDVVLHAAVDLV